MIFRWSTYLLLGWSLGWLVARSVILEPVRSRIWRLDQGTIGWRQAEGGVVGRTLAGVLHYALAFLTGVSHCSACSGFWIGLALHTWGEAYGLPPAPLPLFALGLVVMGTNALVDAVLVGALALSDRGSVDG